MVPPFWKLFLERAARQSVAGSFRSYPGVQAAWVHSALPIHNATYLTGPVETADALRRCCSAALQDATPHNLPWAFYIHQSHLAPNVEDHADSVAQEFGLMPAGRLRVMTGDLGQLQPPHRPLPALEFRRVDSRELSWTALDLNTRAYGMPLAITDTVVESQAYFRDPATDFGFVAFTGGQPVSTATVIALDDWLYVAAVATDPAQRQKGYAEAVMRHALSVAGEALGHTQTALDASLIGSTLYAQMGYRDAGEIWRMYVHP